MPPLKCTDVFTIGIGTGSGPKNRLKKDHLLFWIKVQALEEHLF